MHPQSTVRNFLQAFWKIQGKTRENDALPKYIGYIWIKQEKNHWSGILFFLLLSQTE